jgi:hypothetical protein
VILVNKIFEDYVKNFQTWFRSYGGASQGEVRNNFLNETIFSEYVCVTKEVPISYRPPLLSNYQICKLLNCHLFRYKSFLINF